MGPLGQYNQRPLMRPHKATPYTHFGPPALEGGLETVWVVFLVRGPCYITSMAVFPNLTIGFVRPADQGPWGVFVAPTEGQSLDLVFWADPWLLASTPSCLVVLFEDLSYSSAADLLPRFGRRG